MEHQLQSSPQMPAALSQSRATPRSASFVNFFAWVRGHIWQKSAAEENSSINNTGAATGTSESKYPYSCVGRVRSLDTHIK